MARIHRRHQIWWQHFQGRMAERVTAAILMLQGWKILARNLRTPHAEIDLFCVDESGLVIVEVKYRSSLFGDPVSFQQRTRLARSASWLLGRLSCADPRRKKGIRIDIVLIRRHRWRVCWHHWRGCEAPFHDDRRWEADSR